MGDAGDLLILFGNAFRRVDHQQRYVAALDGGDSPYDGELLHVVRHLAAAADAGGIDQRVLDAILLERRIDGIPGGAGNVAHDHPLLTHERVDDGGLAHVGLADDGDLDVVFLFFRHVPFGEALHDLLQQVSETQLVRAGDGEGFAQAQFVEIVIVVGHLRCVDLVGDQDDFLSFAAQHGGHFLVCGGQPVSAVHHKQHDVGHVHGQLRLHAHLCRDDLLGVRFDAAGVDQEEMVTRPFRFRDDAVSRYARCILHDGDALAHDLIEKC